MRLTTKVRISVAAAVLSLAAMLGLGFALAQVPGLYIASPTGLEQVNVLVESTGTIVTNPQIQTVTLNQIRNASGHSLVATGTTVTSAPTNVVGNLIATGAITTWNVTLPNPAFDGEVFQAVNGTGSTFTSNVTVTAATTPQSQTLAQSYSSQTINAGAAAEWTFDLASLTWYRIR
jgi:hypothetical protein